MDELELLLAEAIKEGDGKIEPAIITTLKVTLTARQKTYAHPFHNFLLTAAKWSLRWRRQLGGKILTPYDVALGMFDLKDARLDNTAHRDGIVDGMGYISCYDRIALWLIAHGYANTWEEATGYFDGWTLAQLIEFQAGCNHD